MDPLPLWGMAAPHLSHSSGRPEACPGQECHLGPFFAILGACTLFLASGNYFHRMHAEYPLANLDDDVDLE